MPNADRLIEVFNDAKGCLAGTERERFLAEACAGDAELKEQVLSLLQAHEGAGDFLKNTQVLPTALVTEKPGDTIGRYKLLQQLGEGGCGVVYMAEQSEPVRRKVALKVIKLGMDTKQVVARFEAERQALALMDHPNIAKVYDAGSTERPLTPSPVAAGVPPAVEPGVPPGGTGSARSGARESSQPGPGGKMPPSTAGGTPAATLSAGRPYFVMELVRGIKITDYCDQNRLSTRERLDLFIQVCQAVQHAHQKGIIHRDIKPSNILVAQHDTVAVPKVIDFGIAKATSDQPLTDKTLFTAFEQFMGTPAYMSPEQAQLSGLDIDTRTDIYSLGVLLYELLTGQPPFDPEELMKSGLEAMRKTIREVEPVKPSTRLTMEVAADVRRRTSKSEIRNPKSEMDGASSRRLSQVKELIPLLRGDLDWIVMKCLEKDRTRRYETANGLAADLKRHLNNEPVVACPPGNLYRLQKLVRRNKLAFAAATAVTAAVVIGLVISSWLYFKETKARQRAVVAEQTQSRLRQEAETARANEIRFRQQAEREAANIRQVERFIRATLEDLAATVAFAQDKIVLEEVLANGVGRVRRELKDQPLVQAELLRQMAMMMSEIKQHAPARALLDEAAELLRQGLSLRAATNAPEVGLSVNLLSDLGRVLARQQKWKEAEDVLARALLLQTETTSNTVENVTGPIRFQMLTDMLEIQRQQQQFAAAEKTARELISLPGAPTDDLRLASWPARKLAEVVEKQGKTEESERIWREILAAQMPYVTNNSFRELAAETRRHFAGFQGRNGKYAEAEELLRKEAEDAGQYGWHREVVDSLLSLAWQAREANPELAIRCAAKAEQLARASIRETQFGPGPDAAFPRGHIGSALIARAVLDRSLVADAQASLLLEARPLLKGFLDQCEYAGMNDVYRVRESADVWRMLENVRCFAALLTEALPEEARGWAQRAAELEIAIELLEKVDQHCRDGRLAEAEELAGQALAVERQTPAPRAIRLVRHLRLLAMVLQEEHKYNEAEVLLVEAFEITERVRPLDVSHENLVKNSLHDLFVAYRESPPRTQRGRELAALFRSQASYQLVRSACVQNQFKIHNAKRQWARDFNKGPDDTPTATQLRGPNNYLRHLVECPGGGSYTIGAVKDPPFCSVHGPACNDVSMGAYDFKWNVFTPGDAASEQFACRIHRGQIDLAKHYWARENKKLPADVPLPGDIFGSDRRIKSESKCPSGGMYTLGAVNESSRCSVHGRSD